MSSYALLSDVKEVCATIRKEIAYFQNKLIAYVNEVDTKKSKLYPRLISQTHEIRESGNSKPIQDVNGTSNNFAIAVKEFEHLVSLLKATNQNLFMLLGIQEELKSVLKSVKIPVVEKGFDLSMRTDSLPKDIIRELYCREEKLVIISNCAMQYIYKSKKDKIATKQRQQQQQQQQEYEPSLLLDFFALKLGSSIKIHFLHTHGNPAVLDWISQPQVTFSTTTVFENEKEMEISSTNSHHNDQSELQSTKYLEHGRFEYSTLANIFYYHTAPKIIYTHYLVAGHLCEEFSNYCTLHRFNFKLEAIKTYDKLEECGKLQKPPELSKEDWVNGWTNEMLLKTYLALTPEHASLLTAYYDPTTNKQTLIPSPLSWTIIDSPNNDGNLEFRLIQVSIEAGIKKITPNMSPQLIEQNETCFNLIQTLRKSKLVQEEVNKQKQYQTGTNVFSNLYPKINTRHTFRYNSIQFPDLYLTAENCLKCYSYTQPTFFTSIYEKGIPGNITTYHISCIPRDINSSTTDMNLTVEQNTKENNVQEIYEPRLQEKGIVFLPPSCYFTNNLLLVESSQKVYILNNLHQSQIFKPETWNAVSINLFTVTFEPPVIKKYGIGYTKQENIVRNQKDYKESSFSVNNFEMLDRNLCILSANLYKRKHVAKKVHMAPLGSKEYPALSSDLTNSHFSPAKQRTRFYWKKFDAESSVTNTLKIPTKESEVSDFENQPFIDSLECIILEDFRCDLPNSTEEGEGPPSDITYIEWGSYAMYCNLLDSVVRSEIPPILVENDIHSYYWSQNVKVLNTCSNEILQEKNQERTFEKSFSQCFQWSYLEEQFFNHGVLFCYLAHLEVKLKQQEREVNPKSLYLTPSLEQFEKEAFIRMKQLFPFCLTNDHTFCKFKNCTHYNSQLQCMVIKLENLVKEIFEILSTIKSKILNNQTLFQFVDICILKSEAKNKCTDSKIKIFTPSQIIRNLQSRSATNSTSKPTEEPKFSMGKVTTTTTTQPRRGTVARMRELRKEKLEGKGQSSFKL